MEKIACIVILVLYGAVMLLMCCIYIFPKEKKPKNKVHFYVARDMNGKLWLYIGKPFRGAIEFYDEPDKGVIMLYPYNFDCFGLNKNDYVNLKWEDEPIEVFLNMERLRYGVCNFNS